MYVPSMPKWRQPQQSPTLALKPPSLSSGSHRLLLSDPARTWTGSTHALRGNPGAAQLQPRRGFVENHRCLRGPCGGWRFSNSVFLLSNGCKRVMCVFFSRTKPSSLRTLMYCPSSSFFTKSLPLRHAALISTS